MDNQYIEDNEIGIKYLRNQLTPEEVEEYEVYLMENPEVVDELEMISVLNNGLSSNLHINEKQGAGNGQKSWLQAPKEVSKFLATIVLGALIGFMGKEVFVGNEKNVEVVEWHELYVVRGGSNTTRTIKLSSKKSQYVALLVDVGGASNENLSIEILKIHDSKRSTQVFDINSPKFNEDGTVMLMVPQQLLSAGSYELNAFDEGRVQLAAVEFRVSRSD